MRFIICALILLIESPIHATPHHPQEFLQSVSGAKNEGEQIYNHFCVNCHASKPLISIGAPKVGVENDWKMRLKQGMTVLFNHTNEGINAMPSRGGCFECTDKQLMLAIDFMLPKPANESSTNTLKDHKKNKK
ncbi:MAG: cytochrome c5 family protein [Legionella longbeachae]|nr:cytochrome c5 family protein [Legionella longbeachae]